MALFRQISQPQPLDSPRVRIQNLELDARGRVHDQLAARRHAAGQRKQQAAQRVGILGPFFWSDAKMWLAIPTSVFAMTLLPFAYLSFFLLMNQKQFLGADMPKGGTRVLWNTLMAISAGLAGFASVWSLWSKLGWYGIAIVVVFCSAVAIDYLRRSARVT